MSATTDIDEEILLDFMVQELKDPETLVRFGLLLPLDFWPPTLLSGEN